MASANSLEAECNVGLVLHHLQPLRHQKLWISMAPPCHGLGTHRKKKNQTITLGPIQGLVLRLKSWEMSVFCKIKEQSYPCPCQTSTACTMFSCSDINSLTPSHDPSSLQNVLPTRLQRYVLIPFNSGKHFSLPFYFYQYHNSIPRVFHPAYATGQINTTMKWNIDKLNFGEIKNFCSSKDIIKRGEKLQKIYMHYINLTKNLYLEFFKSAIHNKKG